MSELANAVLTEVCPFCKCGPDSRCRVGGEECGWLNAKRECCTNPGCVRALSVQKKKAKRERAKQVAVMVRPIRERWQEDLRQKRERFRRSARRKVKGRAA